MKNQNPSARFFQCINKKIYTAKKIKIKDTILVVGSPRSGTTWLMDILAALPDYTYTFEPLNPIWSPGCFEVGFSSRTFIETDKSWPEGEDYLKKIFTGNISDIPIKDSLILSLITGFSIRNTMRQLFGNKLIVKSVNMNRMLPWIAKKFQLRKIFFIIRHPCAVIASQLKTGLCGYRSSNYPYKDIFPTQKNILDEASKITEFDNKLHNILKKKIKIEEILAISWCLDNYIPLSYKKPNKWSFIFYEKLVKDGEKEIINIFNEIGEHKIPDEAFYKLKKPSVVVVKKEKKFIKKPIEQLSKWKKTLSKTQIENILKIVSEFGLGFYSDEIEPNNDYIQTIL